MHEGHRDRMKKHALEDGFSGFANHEIVEMALFYTNPRANVNPIAHALYERFGSLKGILEARVEDLMEVDGIREHSALFFKLLLELLRRYANEQVDRGMVYKHLSDIAKCFQFRFIGITHEELHAMFLNNRMQMIKYSVISRGTVNATDVSIRRLIEDAFRCNAATIVLAHNHPEGMPIASTADLEMTDYINSSCQSLGVHLLEHLIITDGGFWPIMKQHCGMFRSSPYVDKVDVPFYEKFYNVDEENYHFEPLIK